MAELLPQEQAVLDVAAEVDAAKDASFEQMAPSGYFPASDLNALVDSLNSVLPLFNLPAYPAFTEDLDGPLPTEFVQQLSMVADAAAASGLERLSFDVTTVSDSGDLEDIQARLDTLANNQSFITFLRSEAQGEPEGVAEDAPPFDVEAAVVAEGPSGEDMEAMMMERM
tara:strand:- start:33 stop:539 length:507 start_codon:yes stop_codon:yes gene_type:complete